MRVAPSGRAVVPKRDKPIGEAQRQLLTLLKEHPHIDATRVALMLKYRDAHHAELALQGLVKRGFVCWRPGSRPQSLVYHLAPKGLTKLEG